MSNPDHLEKLKQGSAEWNRWRATKPPPTPDLSGAGLEGLDLTGYDLSGANLRGVTFGNCKLSRADLRETDLQGADLSTAGGPFFGQQLAGANLARAVLPEDLKDLAKGLDDASSISDSAQKLFFLMMAACLYSWLTIATTSDVNLITNDVTSALPIIDTNIPIVGFYVVAPLVLLAIYIYFQITMQRFYDAVSSMPAVFPDGSPLYARSDPLLFSDFLRAHFSRLRQDRPIHSYIQRWIAIALAWCTIPYTLALFWLRYLSRHEIFGTVLHATCLLLSIACALYFHWLAVATLRRKLRGPIAGEATRRRLGIWRPIAALSVFAAVVVGISLGGFYGYRYGVPGRDWWPPEPSEGIVAKADPRRWAPSLLQFVGASPFADLRGVNLSTKGVPGAESGQGVANLIRGQRLGAIDLRYADLRGASLPGAVLPEATLEWSDLLAADLTGSELSLANMSNTDLLGAKLERADLSGAVLKGANLAQAQFTEADVEFADFRGSLGLAADEIKKARNWCNAFYDPEMLAALGLEKDNNDRVANWRSYDEGLTKGYPAAAESARLQALSRLDPSKATQTVELIGGLNDPAPVSENEDADLQNQAKVLVRIPWPPGSAPLPAPLPGRPSPDAELPAADYVVVTWTVVEAAAVAALFTPGVDAKDWYPYRHLFNSKFKDRLGPEASASTTKLLGRYFPVSVQGKKVLFFKSDLHFLTDGSEVPLADLVKQIMQETKSRFIVTMGTAGAVGGGLRGGDVIISSTAIFELGQSEGDDYPKSYAIELPRRVAWESADISRDQIELASRILLPANSGQLSKMRVGFPSEPHIFWKDTPQPDVVVSTDYFAIDNTTNASKLQCLGSVTEPDDAVIGLGAPRWLSVRAVADPQAKDSSSEISHEMAMRAAVLYKRYGFWATVQAAIAVWAVITGSQFQ
jgi:uncharacterized protein YjbI with pentapeptide repeats